MFACLVVRVSCLPAKGLDLCKPARSAGRQRLQRGAVRGVVHSPKIIVLWLALLPGRPGPGHLQERANVCSMRLLRLSAENKQWSGAHQQSNQPGLRQINKPASTDSARGMLLDCAVALTSPQKWFPGSTYTCGACHPPRGGQLGNVPASK